MVIMVKYFQGFTKGYDSREYAFNKVQIFADGSMSSDYVEEFAPSTTLHINETFRMHAGSRVEVSTRLSIMRGVVIGPVEQIL